ncbi:MAG TPA: hypothetical protein VFR84_06375 [Candidatus Angelobacter sp.]|nr:hypothetical protein [Candidatus Angelobacter sp.]
MSKEEIIRAVMECAVKLGHTPSHIELMKHANVSRKAVRQAFGTYRGLLEQCGLVGIGSGYRAPLEDLFRDWATVARKLKKLPTISEYDFESKYSVRPLTLRFETWRNVPHGLKQYAVERGWEEEWKDVLAMVEAREQEERAIEAWRSKPGPDNVRRARRFAIKSATEVQTPGPESGNKVNREGREVYGRLLRPGPMICAPTNEQGVVLLFGAMAEKLGFAVLKMGTKYPDCEAFRVRDDGKLERVHVEFELESRNFLVHMHQTSKADMIVCWWHNWKDCPLEVIELSKLF